MGSNGIEPSTSCLSGMCSNHLSYEPICDFSLFPFSSTCINVQIVHWKINNKITLNIFFLLRKEVIQPHLPIRLPCYDFTPIIDSTFDCCLYKLAHRLRVFPTLMVWRAVCTRPGNVFTAVCWPAITSNSGFMKANFSLQSELRLLFWVLLHLAVSLPSVIAIVVRV